jgi:hypothetical protein
MSLYSTKLDQVYRFISAGKFLFGFFYHFIGDKNFGEQNCIALFDFFLSKIVYLYRFKRYSFEYCCPTLPFPHQEIVVPDLHLDWSLSLSAVNSCTLRRDKVQKPGRALDCEHGGGLCQQGQEAQLQDVPHQREG